MDKSKIIPIILFLIIIIISFGAWTFYTQKQNLDKDNAELKDKNRFLGDENETLKYKNNNLQREKEEIEERLSTIGDTLSRIEEDRDSYKRRYDEASRERDQLAEKIKQMPIQKIGTMDRSSIDFSRETVATQGMTEDQWADFVKKKASLEARLEDLNETLFNTKNKIAHLDKENKELSLKTDQVSKEKERLKKDIRLQERTLRIMSMDLVSEREERSSAVKELRKLRSENVSLKRELVLANKDKIKLQNSFKTATEKKNDLEYKIMEAENVLKEKAMMFSDLQERLERTISGAKKISARGAASVELPPIVVKPDTPGLRGVRGEIVAVNREENFVVVDIGEGSGLRPGMLLKVMRGDREIATVEVIETRREISAADIKEVVGGCTIQESDIVISR